LFPDAKARKLFGIHTGKRGVSRQMTEDRKQKSDRVLYLPDISISPLKWNFT